MNNQMADIFVGKNLFLIKRVDDNDRVFSKNKDFRCGKKVDKPGEE